MTERKRERNVRQLSHCTGASGGGGGKGDDQAFKSKPKTKPRIQEEEEEEAQVHHCCTRHCSCCTDSVS